MFDSIDYAFLHSVVFRPDYPGYTPKVIEAPNRDGVKDTKKRYSHIAVKYLAKFGDVALFQALMGYLEEAHAHACQTFEHLGLPQEFRPSLDYSCLRVLEYPPGTGGVPHCDFDLFSEILYRDQPDKFHYVGETPPEAYQRISEHLHFGSMLPLTGHAGLLVPSEHYVEPSDTWQHSIVFFAVPDWKTKLTTGETVGDWIQRETAKARYEA